MDKIIYPIIIVVIFYHSSCSQNKKENDTIDNYGTEINYMQNKVDSVALIYDLAIIDFKSGKDSVEIITKYEFDITRLQHDVVLKFDSITNLYTKKEINDNLYHEIMNNVKMD